MFMSAVVLSCLVAAGLMTSASADHHRAAVIELAAIAAAPEPAKGATVMDRPVVDREGNVLKVGDNGWTHGPSPPHLQETPPMCDDGVWMEWADAYLHEKGYAGGMFGICSMLAGATREQTDFDPYPEGPTDDSQWITGGACVALPVSGSA